MDSQRNDHQIACMDAVGRPRSARVFPAGFGCVAVQAPPGESMVLTVEQLHELWVAAREVCRLSWLTPVTTMDYSATTATATESAA